MSKDTIFIAILSVIPYILFGQSLERFSLEIRESGQVYKSALAGGMNQPEFSSIDLDHDGVEDIYVFDKEGNAQAAFKYENGSNYAYAPELLEHFPRLNKWALLYDYNQDGAADIFAFTSQPGVAGIEVHKGYWDGNKLAFQKLSFAQTFDILYYQGSNNPINLYVSNIDIPAFADVDNDGDMDILTFAAAGGYVIYYQNLSQEQGHGNDTLIFNKADPCWGKFYESGNSKSISLSSDPNACAQGFWDDEAGYRHTGSTVLALDTDSDGDQELFLGDVSYNNIVLLYNTGTAEKAFVTAQDTTFPKAFPVDIPIFPAAFGVDVDHDGKTDILSAPNATSTALDQQNVWLYKSLGNSQFEFVQKDFLVKDMLDLGTGAYPTFADINGDGLLDMLVGNKSSYTENGALDSRLNYYKNIGSVENPKFELVDNDFLGLNAESQNHWNFAPNFGDLDNDGDLDLMVGEYLGSLYYFENTAGADKPMVFADPIFPYAGVDVGLVATPFMVDVDEDGLVDILIGERNGNINFIKNIGTATAPQFNSNHEEAPNNSFWGAIDTRALGSVTGYSAPRMWKEKGSFKLFVGNQQGTIYAYDDIENNLAGTIPLIDNNYGNLQDGSNLYPCFLDLNNDGYRELIIGNQRGGLTGYKTKLTQPVSASEVFLSEKELIISPNPSKDYFVPHFGESPNKFQTGEISIFNTTGQLIYKKTIHSGDSISIKNFAQATYTVEVISNNNRYIGKLIAD